MGPFGVVGGVFGRVRHVVGGTVERFVAEVRRQVDESRSDERQPADAPASTPDAGGGAAVADRATSTSTDLPATGELALPDYDLLPAAHVVAALGDLEQDERDAIESYERARRHRRTILGKLDQLRRESEAKG